MSVPRGIDLIDRVLHGHGLRPGSPTDTELVDRGSRIARNGRPPFFQRLNQVFDQGCGFLGLGLEEAPASRSA